MTNWQKRTTTRGLWSRSDANSSTKKKPTVLVISQRQTFINNLYWSVLIVFNALIVQVILFISSYVNKTSNCWSSVLCSVQRCLWRRLCREGFFKLINRTSKNASEAAKNKGKMASRSALTWHDIHLCSLWGPTEQNYSREKWGTVVGAEMWDWLLKWASRCTSKESERAGGLFGRQRRGRARGVGCNDSYSDDVALGRRQGVELCLTSTGAEEAKGTVTAG